MDFSHLGIEARSWALTFSIFALSLCALIAAHHIILSRLRRSTAKNVTLIADYIEIVKATKYSCLVAIAAYIASRSLHMSPDLRRGLDRACLVIFLLQCCLWGNKGITFWADSYVKKESLTDPSDTTTVGLLSFTAKIIFYSVILLIALRGFGFNVTALIAGLGLGGVAVALAVQSILADLFACFTIKLDKPYIVGDFIVIGEFLGTVEHVGLKTTRIRSLSGEQLIFSNADLLQSRVRNYKRMSERRVSLFLCVTFQTPENKLALIPTHIRSIINEQQEVRFERCHFLRFSPSSFDFEVVYWVQSPDFFVHADIAQTINLAIVRYFNEEGIQFAYPSHTVFMAQKEMQDARTVAPFRGTREPPTV